MMKMLTVAAASILSVSLSMGVASADPKGISGADSATKGGDAKSATPPDQRKYCIEDTLTGSRIKSRECKTRAEWMKEGIDPLNS